MPGAFAAPPGPASAWPQGAASAPGLDTLTAPPIQNVTAAPLLTPDPLVAPRALPPAPAVPLAAPAPVPSSPVRLSDVLTGPPLNNIGAGPGMTPSPLWASDPAGFGQVGCIYTAQGFEYDYAGVIIGPDLVWRTDRWVAQREGSKDPAFRSRTSVTDAAFDALIRNVYKVLLTRGMRGAALLSTDRQTQDFLATLLTGAKAPAHRSPSPG